LKNLFSSFLLEKRKEKQKKTVPRFQRSELCNLLGTVLIFHMLEKFFGRARETFFSKKVFP
jgi:hypothetical protein